MEGGCHFGELAVTSNTVETTAAMVPAEQSRAAKNVGFGEALAAEMTNAMKRAREYSIAMCERKRCEAVRFPRRKLRTMDVGDDSLEEMPTD